MEYSRCRSKVLKRGLGGCRWKGGEERVSVRKSGESEGEFVVEGFADDAGGLSAG